MSGECGIIRITFKKKKILLILSKRYSSGATDSAKFILILKLHFLNYKDNMRSMQKSWKI